MKRILYVEDDLSLIDGLQYTLEKNDFAVDNVRTVKEAYTFFHANTYDLILLDITLPDGTGYDVCREVRRPAPGTSPGRTPFWNPLGLQLICHSARFGRERRNWN